MRRFSMLAALAALTFGFGCGATATTATTTAVSPITLATQDVLEVPDLGEALVALDPVSTMNLEGLPVAPWAGTPLASDAVPAPVLTAWANAANRAQCAPIAPARLGAADGASARVSPELVEGGWAVEFDRRGLPGMDADGESCTRCGRGVFGIAGTQMAPDQLVGEDDDAEAPAPTFADGSHLALEPPSEGESVAAASLTVRGQGCVYQVWSFLGEDHLRELVSEMRLVEVRTPSVVAAR